MRQQIIERRGESDALSAVAAANNVPLADNISSVAACCVRRSVAIITMRPNLIILLDLSHSTCTNN